MFFVKDDPSTTKEFFMIGHTELLIIVLVILVLFGAAAIPKFARSLGQAKKEFTKAMKEGEEEEKQALQAGKQA
jgi:sec-independent protein translocase protein TatA